MNGDAVGDDGGRDERKRSGKRSRATTTREGGRVSEGGAVSGKSSARDRMDSAATLSADNCLLTLVSPPTNHARGGRGGVRGRRKRRRMSKCAKAVVDRGTETLEDGSVA